MEKLKIGTSTFISPEAESNTSCDLVEFDDDTTESPVQVVGKKLKQKPIAFKGQIICRICFDGCDSKNAKRYKFEKIKDVTNVKDTTNLWITKEHVFNNVYSKND